MTGSNFYEIAKAFRPELFNTQAMKEQMAPNKRWKKMKGIFAPHVN